MALLYLLIIISAIAIIAFSNNYIFKNSKKSKVKPIGKERFEKIFSLDKNLKDEINNFLSQKTELFFHFINFNHKKNNIFKKLKFSSSEKIYDIENKTLKIDYEDKKYPYRYNITEEIIISNDKKEAKFLIVINKHKQNHYNVIINSTEERSFSLELIFYSKNEKFLPRTIKISNINFNSYEEGNFEHMTRINIINASKNQAYEILCFEMDYKEKLKFNNQIFSQIKNNDLMFNFIYSNDEKNKKILYRRIFDNEKEIEFYKFTFKEYLLMDDLYNQVIEKYINEENFSPYINDQFLKDFNVFDYAHGYKLTIEPGEKEPIIRSDLRDIVNKFNMTPFFKIFYEKEELEKVDLRFFELLIYLDLIFFDIKSSLVRIQDFIEKKNKFFNEVSYLSDPDKILIMLNLLSEQIKPKTNFTLRSFYDLAEKSPYVQSELFYRNIISRLNKDSCLVFYYLQLNSGSDIDYLSKSNCYKIRTIPLIEIQNHLLNEFFYPYFFSYESENNTDAVNSAATHIKSYNESRECGYIKPKTLGTVENTQNMIKLTFRKFHEGAHTKYKGDYNYKIEPRYSLNYNLDLIDNKKNKFSYEMKSEIEGEAGEDLLFYIFNDYKTCLKLYSSNEDLSELYDINLFIQGNFDDLRRIVKEKVMSVDRIQSNPFYSNNSSHENGKITLKKYLNKNNKYCYYKDEIA